MVTSSLVANAHVNCVVSPGCNRRPRQFIRKFDPNLVGHVRSIVDHKDDSFGACGPMFEASAGGLEHKEIVL
ncbi:MAG: hypothetical protein P8076_03205 [Gammaproteobacteria bacterium]